MDNQFIPSEQNQTPVELTAPILDQAALTKEARSQFSKIGLIYVLGALLIVGIQYLVIAIMNVTNPALLSNINSSLLLTMIPMYAVAMPIIMFFIKKFIPATRIEKKKMPVSHWLIIFTICYAGMYLSNIAGLILTQVISLVKGSPVANGILDIATSTNLWINIFVMVLLAPIFEELLFRKLLIDRTVRYGEGISVLFSGLMFGLFHGNLNQFAYAFVLGLLFGFVYVKTGNIKYTIILHMVINFMGSVLGILILKFLDYDALMAASSNPADMMPYVTAHLPQLLLYVFYLILVFGLMITGIIFFIVKAKQFRCLPGEVVIPKGKRFSTTILNLGMILYLVYWIVMIILQLFQ